MMTFDWGVITYAESNQKLKNGYTLYDWVTRQKGLPEFWGRNISGTHSITKEEIEFLYNQECNVLLFENSFTEVQISSNYGADCGWRTIEKLCALGIPQNNSIAIFILIPKDWSVNHFWMISYAQTLRENGYIPGFIGNTDSSINFNFDRQCSHFINATQKSNHYDALFGATEPKVPSYPKSWAPYCPSALERENISLWLCSEIAFCDIAIDIGCLIDDSVKKYMLKYKQ